MKSPKEYSAFVSYASEDHEKAEEICASLEARGRVCWIAPRDVREGREYADEIIGGLERSASAVLVLSEHANTSVFVRREVERAVSKQIPVFPVRIAEVTPSPGLELFVSGTQWLDAWQGNWDEHMDRLARDLADDQVEEHVGHVSSGHRSVSEHRSFRRVYVGVGLVLFMALSGIGIWSLTPARARQVEAPLPRDEDQKPAGEQRSSSTITQEQREQVLVPATGVAASPPPLPRRAAVPSPRAVETTGELNALREDYDDLSIRGGVIDDTLNQLWTDMKPASPRVDMLTHQRSLQTNLRRSKDALAEKDAAGARRYLEIARADLEALAQFLNR